MKKILLLTLLFFAFGSFAQDCSNFKDGTYSYGSNAEFKSIRTGKVQKSIKSGEYVAKWRVEWPSECQIKLTCTKVIDKTTPFRKGMVIYADILSTDENCYTYQTFNYVNGKKNILGPPATMCKE